jgi:hypothetical protein
VKSIRPRSLFSFVISIFNPLKVNSSNIKRIIKYSELGSTILWFHDECPDSSLICDFGVGGNVKENLSHLSEKVQYGG